MAARKASTIWRSLKRESRLPRTTRLVHADVVEQLVVLPLVEEVDPPALHVFEEGVARVVLRVVAVAHYPPQHRRVDLHLAEARAEVGDRVAQLAAPAALSRRVEDF